MDQPEWFKEGQVVRVIDADTVNLPDEYQGIVAWLGKPYPEKGYAHWRQLIALSEISGSWWIKPEACEPLYEDNLTGDDQ